MAERAAPVLPAKGPADVVALATRAYLDGAPIDMSALAQELGIGRATLYRWVGNREELLGTVVARAMERTFGDACRETTADGGVEYVVDVLSLFMRAILAAPGLKALTQREPMLFVRLATAPGLIESRAAALIGALLDREHEAGRLTLALPTPALATAIVRICDVHMFAHLLGRTTPEIETALDTVRVLLSGR